MNKKYFLTWIVGNRFCRISFIDKKEFVLIAVKEKEGRLYYETDYIKEWYISMMREDAKMNLIEGVSDPDLIDEYHETGLKIADCVEIGNETKINKIFK